MSAPEQDPTPTRRYRRRTVRVQIEYLLIDQGVAHRATATTLGAGGLFVETEAAPEIGTRLELRFRLTAAGAEHALMGRVKWVHRPAEGGGAGSPGMGIEFDDLGPEASSRIDAIVRALRTDSAA